MTTYIMPMKIIPDSPWLRIVAGSLASAGFATYIWKKRAQAYTNEDLWLKFLADAPLRSTKDQSGKPFKAGSLWKQRAVLILALRKPWCQNRHDAAAIVSALVKPELDKHGIALFAVTGDTWLVSGLHHNLKGAEVFLDVEQRFFIPKQDVEQLFTQTKQTKQKNNNMKAERTEIENDSERLFDGIFLLRPGGIVHIKQVEELKGDINVKTLIRAISKI